MGVWGWTLEQPFAVRAREARCDLIRLYGAWRPVLVRDTPPLTNEPLSTFLDSI